MQSARNRAHLGIAFLQERRDAAQGPAGTHRGDKYVHLAVGLAPDLGTGGLIVRQAVGSVVELIGPDAIGQAGGVPARLLLIVHVVRVGRLRYGANLRAERLQEIDLLRRLIVRDVDDARIPPGVADVRKTDAGVSGGALHDGATGTQGAALLVLPDDPQRGTVLDRTAGVQELRLAEDLAAGLFRKPVQANQWCIADGGGEISGCLHPSSRVPRLFRYQQPVEAGARGHESLSARRRRGKYPRRSMLATRGYNRRDRSRRRRRPQRVSDGWTSAENSLHDSCRWETSPSPSHNSAFVR